MSSRILSVSLGCMVGTGFLAVRAESIARVWDEQALSAIRIDTPHPPVHARNLFHLSVVMYDAWAAYASTARGYIHHRKHPAADVAAARRESISYAAYRILSERYRLSRSAAKTQAALDARMAALGYDPKRTATDGENPAAVGNAVAAEVSAAFIEDGFRQAANYQDLPAEQGGYIPVNPALVVAKSGTLTVDINRWQPLAIENAVDQNGFPLGPVQTFLGSQCLRVKPFALTRTDPGKPWIDPGRQPCLGGVGDAQFREEVVDVLRYASHLSPDDGVMMEISPGAFGNNPLGSNDGTGHALNPATGQPYAPNFVRRGDFGRVMAEFWADGPSSETPPGHWNVLANWVSDHPACVKRIGGEGPLVDDLEWDVKVYFAINGALHDAACAAWSLKRYYDGGRPIQYIRQMGQLGQCSNPDAPSYHPGGLPLVPGLIELVTPFTRSAGQRHAGLAAGSIAVFSWPGQPANPTNDWSRTRWVASVDWIPYQRKNFVTPSFPGYISGHSTFSRAAAEVLAAFTGSPFFPGGLATFTAPGGAYLTFEKGPTRTVQLQWGTYFDASDQAGQSRLWGGIHVRVDDFTGRRVGAECGRSAWALARRHFQGGT